MKSVIISEEQLKIFEGIKTQDKKKVDKYIAEYSNPEYAQPYLQTPLSELPSFLYNMCTNGHEPSGDFKAVLDNQFGQNRFIDFLRLNLYSQFGIKHGRGPEEYVRGIARIACADLGFYSFGTSMNGGKIVKFGRLLNLIDKMPNFMLDGIELDSELNGMNYTEFERTFEPKLEEYQEIIRRELSSQTFDGNTRYQIIPLSDTISQQGIPSPTPQSKRVLNMLGQYTDWCICGAIGDFEYGQYLANGGKFYICARDDFKTVQKEPGEGCPLDDYGLSLIAVVVGSDGVPDNITTRWNHEFGGENNERLWNAKQLQDVLQVNYFQTFKPRPASEIRAMHLTDERLREEKTPAAQDQVGGKVRVLAPGTVCEEGAEPESDEYKIGGEGGNNEYFHVISEDDEKHDDWFMKYIEPIAEFMSEQGLNVKPFPKVKLNWEPQNGLFVNTGYYEPWSKTIVLFCDGRHAKDILRTFAHEMIHHSQNLDGKNLDFSTEDDVKGNSRLEEIESEAYLKGNIYFRKWTEYEKAKEKSLNESKTDSNLYKLINEIQLEDTDPEDVDLSSFSIKKHLNPKFWKDGRLDSRIRMKLLDLADDFLEFMGVDWVEPDDIIMTGSLANFNWNEKYSDIDLHIVMDFSKVDDRKDFVDNYFYSQKKLWNDEHKDLKIFGFPIEVFVQDVNQEHSSTGVYSLEKDKWIVEPDREQLATAKVNKSFIKKKVAKYIDKIESLEKHYKKSEGDEYKIRKVSERSDKLFDKLKNERRKSLGDANNEITEGNIVFKCLRRLGYIERLVNLMSKSYDALNSINETK